MHEVDEGSANPHIFWEPKSGRQGWCGVHDDAIMHRDYAWKSVLKTSMVSINVAEGFNAITRQKKGQNTQGNEKDVSLF